MSKRRTALCLLAALGVVAVVTAAHGAGSGGSRTTSRTTSSGQVSAANSRAQGFTRRLAPLGPAALRRRREALAIDAALRYTPFIAAGTSRRRAIALTFDDGPSPYTQAIVRILVRQRVPATFFVVGQQLAVFAAGLRAELAHGFEIADHTQNHAWLARLSRAAQYSQIQEAAIRIERFGPPAPRLFRPPYGAYNRATMATLRRLKMLMVMWSIDPGDWRRPGTSAIVSNVLSNARPGAIVIMHDGGGDRSQTVAALPAIIKGLRRRHYQLVAVPQLVIEDPPPRRQRLPHLSGV